MSRPKKPTSGKCSWTPSRTTSSMPSGPWTVVTWPRRTPTKATSSWKTLTSWHSGSGKRADRSGGGTCSTPGSPKTPGMGKTPSWGYLPIPPGSTGSKLPQAATMVAGTANSRSGKGVSVVVQPDATGLYYIAVGVGRRRPDGRVQGQGDRRGGGKRVPAGKVGGPRPPGQRRRR